MQRFLDRFTHFGIDSTANKILHEIIELENKKPGVVELKRADNHDDLVKALASALNDAIDYKSYLKLGENDKISFRHLIAVQLSKATTPMFFSSKLFASKLDLIAEILTAIDYTFFKLSMVKFKLDLDILIHRAGISVFMNKMKGMKFARQCPTLQLNFENYQQIQNQFKEIINTAVLFNQYRISHGLRILLKIADELAEQIDVPAELKGEQLQEFLVTLVQSVDSGILNEKFKSNKYLEAKESVPLSSTETSQSDNELHKEHKQASSREKILSDRDKHPVVQTMLSTDCNDIHEIFHTPGLTEIISDYSHGPFTISAKVENQAAEKTKGNPVINVDIHAGKKFKLEVYPTDTIYSLETQIFQKGGPASFVNYRFFSKNLQLERSKKIEDYDVIKPGTRLAIRKPSRKRGCENTG